jgi:chromosome condensin MukBEF complex kleisin-like MukF subunit
MSTDDNGRNLDTSRHLVPATVVVMAVVMALGGWLRLETHIDQQILEKVAPVSAAVARVEEDVKGQIREVKEGLKDQGTEYQASLKEIGSALAGVRQELQKVRESLVRLEAERSRQPQSPWRKAGDLWITY